jgi:citrate lyase subunit beta/citryl-CoA lyase
MTSPITRARSLLFVPASRPDRFTKALESGAGCVIIDLEDAVAVDAKTSARDQLANHLGGFDAAQRGRLLVRVNAADTPWHADDLRLLAQWVGQGLGGVMVPKSDAAAVLQDVAARLGPPAEIVPLVESLAGLDAVDLLARAPQVTRLAFGPLDFQLDLGMRCGPEEAELAPVRLALVTASRRAQLAAPIDGVSIDTGDRDRLLADASRARAFGFGGKLCIHPAQVGPVNETFAPSASDVEWAQRVASGARQSAGAVFSLDGRMVDGPVIRLAEKILEQEGAAGSRPA